MIFFYQKAFIMLGWKSSEHGMEARRIKGLWEKQALLWRSIPHHEVCGYFNNKEEQGGNRNCNKQQKCVNNQLDKEY